MKKYIFVLLSILAIFIGCQKEELFGDTAKEVASKRMPIGEVILDNIDTNYVKGLLSSRDGQRDLIFFRNSLTTDNYLLTIGTNVQREHKAYNKYKVAYVKFNLGLIDPINMGGIPYEHYKILIMYKDSTYDKLIGYSKDSLDNFTYYPTGDNILRDAHTAKKVSWTRSGRVKTGVNEFRGVATINIAEWIIKSDSTTISIDFRSPRDKTSNIFQPPHKN